MRLIPDDIDFSAYERQTECAAKVRKASLFADDLVEQLTERDDTRENRPEMFSTKLRGMIEFRPGEVTAWTGYNGHRKSMFTGQVALDLCVQRERVMMASFEMLPKVTLARMARQAAGTASLHPNHARFFASWTDNRLWFFDHTGRITPQKCTAVCRYFADELKGTQVFIDSMMMVCASEESMDEQKQFMTDIVRLASETGLHVHLVTHCRKPQTGEDKRPTKYDLRGSAAISDQAHNIITVWANKAKASKLDANPFDELAHQEPDAVVAVDKQRNGAFEGAAKLWWHAPSMRFMDDRTSQVLEYEFMRGH